MKKLVDSIRKIFDRDIAMSIILVALSTMALINIFILKDIKNDIAESKASVLNEIDTVHTEIDAIELEPVVIYEEIEVETTEEEIEEVVESTTEFKSDNNVDISYAPAVADIAQENNEDPMAYDQEFWYMCQVVEAETHGCDQDSKVHVAHVIRNRVNSPLFPNTITQVCLQPSQFVLRSDVEQSTIDAVNYALSIEDTTGGALFFHSGGYTSTFSGASYVFTDSCGHHFYTK